MGHPAERYPSGLTCVTSNEGFGRYENELDSKWASVVERTSMRGSFPRRLNLISEAAMLRNFNQLQAVRHRFLACRSIQTNVRT
jgi:hypothetical protein